MLYAVLAVLLIAVRGRATCAELPNSRAPHVSEPALEYLNASRQFVALELFGIDQRAAGGGQARATWFDPGSPVGHQVSHFHTQRTRDPVDTEQGDVALSGFNGDNVRSVKVGEIGQFLLGDANPIANCSNSIAESRFQLLCRLPLHSEGESTSGFSSVCRLPVTVTGSILLLRAYGRNTQLAEYLTQFVGQRFVRGDDSTWLSASFVKTDITDKLGIAVSRRTRQFIATLTVLRNINPVGNRSKNGKGPRPETSRPPPNHQDLVINRLSAFCRAELCFTS